MRARIHHTPGPRWFGPHRPIRTVHADASMFIGGLSALLQSLHPLDGGGGRALRLLRRSVAAGAREPAPSWTVTTYGTAADAQQAVDHVRTIHERISGTTAEGVPYRAGDPHLLGWVHAAEAHCFLRAHERYGARPPDAADYDAYVADTARVAEALGAIDPPRDRRELSERLIAYRPELRATPEARSAARFLLFQPPLPLVVRPFYGVPAANAVALLPPWVRGMLWLPRMPVVEDLAVRPTGQALTRTIRWAMNPPRQSRPT